MARRPARPCRHPGCHELTRDGWCAKHKPKDKRSEESKAWRWMYGTKIWREDLRPNQLLNEPFCRLCAARGIRTLATDVDHIRDHKGDWAVFCDRSNLESLCHSCHSRKTLAEMQKTAAK